MKLIKINQSNINESKEVPGLVSYRIEYEIKTAKGGLEYLGPKIAPELWHQILSFFRWTHKEMQSECQVRLYVNLKLGSWAAWAFPQQARTGMTARELPVQESPEQARIRFAQWNSEPSDDWLYFGTVHHHCSASAFQSSTDEQNEWNQDGLHITVGKMDEERHDIHARFYLAGNCFEPDLSCFWELEADLAEQVPVSMHDELARYQMGARLTVDFPDIWREHLIESTSEPRTLDPFKDWVLQKEEMQVPLEIRMDDALEDISRYCAALSVQEQDWLADIQTMASCEVTNAIINACVRNRVTLEDLVSGASKTVFEY